LWGEFKEKHPLVCIKDVDTIGKIGKKAIVVMQMRSDTRRTKECLLFSIT
jgi:hypothetical protein